MLKTGAQVIEITLCAGFIMGRIDQVELAKSAKYQPPVRREAATSGNVVILRRSGEFINVTVGFKRLGGIGITGNQTGTVCGGGTVGEIVIVKDAIRIILPLTPIFLPVFVLLQNENPPVNILPGFRMDSLFVSSKNGILLTIWISVTSDISKIVLGESKNIYLGLYVFLIVFILTL